MGKRKLQRQAIYNIRMILWNGACSVLFLFIFSVVYFGFLALPIGMGVGTDDYFYGIMPLAIRLGES